MSLWAQIQFQESYSSIMKSLSLFHDYSLSLIIMILVFVAGVSLSMVVNTLISDSIIITMVEVVWTVIPVLILFLLAVPSLFNLYKMEEMDSFVSVKVTGHQWYWSYSLSDLLFDFDSYMKPSVELALGEFRLLETDKPLVIPFNKNISILVTAGDVLHSWGVSGLGVKVDAVPGRLNRSYINVLRSSVFFGQCSEICGANHSFMPIQVESISSKLFLNWCFKMKGGN